MSDRFVPTILYEDNHLIVAYKPAGILSQSDISGDPDMLTILKSYLKDKYGKPGDVYLGLLHRLDRPVAGVMVFAKTSKCAARISAQIRERRVEKDYRALVYGVPEKQTGELRSYILKDEQLNQVTVIHDNGSAKHGEAKEAILSYNRVAETSMKAAEIVEAVSLLEIRLKTGRSHQIRAQLADAGIPIVGDRKYGSSMQAYRGDICLESFRLSVFHPISGDKMIFEVPISEKEPWRLFAR